MSLQRTVFVSITMLVGLGFGAAAFAQTGADVANSKHNLSATGLGPVTTADDNQVCVFCHTPHGATISPGAPLWNRQLSTQTYTTYTSSSLDAVTIAGQLAAAGRQPRSCACPAMTVPWRLVHGQRGSGGAGRNVNVYR